MRPWGRANSLVGDVTPIAGATSVFRLGSLDNRTWLI